MKHLFFVILLLISLGSLAQEGPVLLMPEEDTVVKEVSELKSDLLPEIPFPNSNLLPDGLPVYQFNPIVGRPYIFSFTHQPLFKPNFSAIGNFQMIFPFFYNGEILSSDAYQIGNKLVFGGFSYGASSIMSAPLPNQMGHSFDTYGSTMFIQYKVSKNFKIETRVSVGKSQGPLPPGF